MIAKNLTKEKYKFRIITAPYRGNEHIFGKVISIKCCFDNCPLCLCNKSTPYWILGVIDRKDDNFGFIKLKYTLFEKIIDLAKNPDIGDPMLYDIELYTNPVNIINLERTILSESDNLIANSINKNDLLDYVKPSSIEDVKLEYEKFKNKLAVLL